MSVETMTIYTMGEFYTGSGHAPHPPGTALTLPKAQAETWIKDKVATAEPPAPPADATKPEVEPNAAEAH